MARFSTAPALPAPASSPRRLMRRMLLPLAALLVAGGCATGGLQTSPPPTADQSLRLQVQNQSASDMVIYSVQSGGRVRLGQITARETRDFRLRFSLQAPTGALRLYAEPMGPGQGFLVTPVEAGQGDRVTVVLDDESQPTRVAVYSRDAGNARRVAWRGAAVEPR